MSESAKRIYGQGSVYVHRGAWYGRWWSAGVRVKRKLGPIREPGGREGLTRKQAEAVLRRLMSEVRVVVPEERMTFQEAGDRYLHHLKHVRNRKPSTLQDYTIIHNKHLAPHFGSKPLDRIAVRDVAAYITAREGGLVALRWRDVDWSASVIRVRRSYTRGQLGTPKSKHSSRALPMADRLGGELDRHFQRSLYKGDDHLVFCHPHTGEPYDASQIRKRFYVAMDAAGMGHRCSREAGITFHSRAACRRSATQDESELSIRSTSPCTRSIASAMSLTGKSYSSANWL